MGEEAERTFFGYRKYFTYICMYICMYVHMYANTTFMCWVATVEFVRKKQRNRQGAVAIASASEKRPGFESHQSIRF
jgi:hypothetical protein